MNIKDSYTPVIKFIVGIAVFSTVLGIASIHFQRTLILYRMGGWIAHWGTIYVLVPAILGIFLRIWKPPLVGAICLIGATISSMFYFEELKELWRDPPHPLFAVYLALTTAAVAYTLTIPVRERWNIFKNRYISNTESRSKKADVTVEKEVVQSFSLSKKESTPILSHPLYMPLVAGFQFIVACLALVMSIISVLWAPGSGIR